MPTMDTDTGTHVSLTTRLDDVEEQELSWLWYPYLAHGQLALLDGDPGTGKSTLAWQIAACLSRGLCLPDQQGNIYASPVAPTRTLLISAEDAVTFTIVPRLRKMDADLSQIHVLHGWAGHEGQVHSFSLKHIDTLVDALERHHPAFVVIDPIQAALGHINMNQANMTRPLLEGLGHVAETYGCAVLMIRHLNKSGSGKAIYRGLGSIDIMGAARTAMWAEEHPNNDNWVLMGQTKSNFTPLGRTQVFGKSGGVFDWFGSSRVKGSLFSDAEPGPDPQAVLKAALWLEYYMSHDEYGEPLYGVKWDSKGLIDAGAEAGHTRSTLYKTRKALGLICVRLHDSSHGATWQLPSL